MFTSPHIWLVNLVGNVGKISVAETIAKGSDCVLQLMCSVHTKAGISNHFTYNIVQKKTSIIITRLGNQLQSHHEIYNIVHSNDKD